MEELIEKYKLARQHFFNSSLYSDLADNKKFKQLLKGLGILTSNDPTATSCYLLPEWYSEDNINLTKEKIWEQTLLYLNLTEDTTLGEVLNGDLKEVLEILEILKAFRLNTCFLPIDEVIEAFLDIPYVDNIEENVLFSTLRLVEVTEDNPINFIIKYLYGDLVANILLNGNEELSLSLTLGELKESNEEGYETIEDKLLSWGMLISYCNKSLATIIAISEITLEYINTNNLDLSLYIQLMLGVIAEDLDLSEIDLSEFGDNGAIVQNYINEFKTNLVTIGNYNSSLYHIYLINNSLTGIKLEDKNYIVNLDQQETCLDLQCARVSDEIFNNIFNITENGN